MSRVFVMMGLLISQLLFATSCEDSETIQDQLTEETADGKAVGLTIDEIIASFVDTDVLNSDETAMLQYMKEEEKLARDVYYALDDIWNARIFTNISKSEENHIAAVIRLIEYYDLGSTEVKSPGEFESEEFKVLYDQLVKKGSQSIEEAMKVGALIEELDIKDLQEKLDATDNENITLVFNNLLRGSRNHLRAFNRQLVKYGVEYTPQYISQEEYDNLTAVDEESY